MNVNDLPQQSSNLGGDADLLRSDPLLEAMLFVCRHYGVTRTPLSLIDGLPYDGAVTPEVGMRALEQVGFSVRMVERDPREIFDALLPVILLRSKGRALVLLARESTPFQSGQQAAEARYRVGASDPTGRELVMTESELLTDYTGFCMLIKLQPKLENRTDLKDPEPPSQWLWSTVWKYRRYYRDALIASVLINVLTTWIGLFSIHVYDRVIPTEAYSTLWSLAIGVFVGLFFLIAASQIRTYLLDLAGRKADIALASILFRRAMGLRMEHMPRSAGTFAHQLRAFESVREFGTSASMSVITDIPFIFLFLYLTWVVAGPLVLIPVVVTVVILTAGLIIQMPLNKLMRSYFQDAAQMTGVMVESIEGMETLRVTGSAGFMQSRYEDYNARTAMSGMRFRLLGGLLGNFVGFMQQLETVGMLIWGVYLIHDGTISAGSLIGATMFANRAIAPLGQFIGLATSYGQAKAALEALNNLMSLPTERDATRNYVQKTRLSGAIGLDRVSFSYPAPGGQRAPLALDEISLQINPGERVAIIGKIGSGKSTMLRMISGLYQPQEGQVQVDGIDIRQIDPADFRSQVGFVTQDLRLIHGTLHENVMLGRPNVDWETFLAVARLTGIDAIAAAHPMGYDLPISEMGNGLSGGQRQLVALARALVTRPRILLMDEPTSAMDMQTESLFVQRLQTIIENRTVIVVTHRPSLLALVDRVIVVDQHRIVADGPKEEVLARLRGSGGTTAAGAAGTVTPSTPIETETDHA